MIPPPSRDRMEAPDSDAGTNEMLDSTTNGNDGSSSGGMDTTDLVDGKMEEAINFDGSDDHVVVPHDASLEMSDVDRVTVAAWMNKDTSQSGWTALLQKSDRSYNHAVRKRR